MGKQQWDFQALSWHQFARSKSYSSSFVKLKRPSPTDYRIHPKEQKLVCRSLHQLSRFLASRTPSWAPPLVVGQQWTSQSASLYHCAHYQHCTLLLRLTKATNTTDTSQAWCQLTQTNNDAQSTNGKQKLQIQVHEL